MEAPSSRSGNRDQQRHQVVMPSITKGSFLRALGPSRSIILSKSGSGASSAFRTRCNFLLQLDHSTIHQHNGLNKSKVPAEMVTKVLCVAEKPSIAKAVAGHLSGGTQRVVSLICSATCISHIIQVSILILLAVQHTHAMAEKLQLLVQLSNLGCLRGGHDKRCWPYTKYRFCFWLQELERL